MTGFLLTFVILWITDPSFSQPEPKVRFLFQKIGGKCEVTAIIYDPDVEDYYLTEDFFDANDCEPTNADYSHGFRVFDGSILPFKRWLFSSKTNRTE